MKCAKPARKKAAKPKLNVKPKKRRGPITTPEKPFLFRTRLAVSEFFGVHEKTVADWQRRSKIDCTSGYPVDQFAQWYVKQYSHHSKDEELSELQREAQRQVTRKLVRVNQEAEGELVHKTIIAAVLRQVLAGARSRFEATPAEIASLLPVEIRDELLVSITNAVERICHSFATDGRDLIENLGNDE